MTSFNIFNSIQKATSSHYERIHTQFLADSLQASLCSNGDRTLFDEVWRCCAPQDWENLPPSSPIIVAEDRLENESKHSKRIDIVIVDKQSSRVIGIEAKTSDSSVEDGQLECYFQLLKAKYKNFDCAVSFLTPFNRSTAKRSEIDEDSISAIREFDRFCLGIAPLNRARHVSWLQIAQIKWRNNPIWTQHKLYVEKEIANIERERQRRSRNRSFDSFFSERALGMFWSELFQLQSVTETSKGGVILDLKEFVDKGENPQCIATAIERLIDDNGYVAYNRKVSGRPFPTDLRSNLRQSKYGIFHEQIFELAFRHRHVEVMGQRNYGLRVAHLMTQSVSVMTCELDKNIVRIGQPR